MPHPYKVNSHKLLHKPRADDIRPHTVQHTLAAVVSAGNEVHPYGVPLITHPQFPFFAPYTQKILPKESLGQDLPFCKHFCGVRGYSNIAVVML